MEPRLASSKSQTPFPKELIEQMIQVATEHFGPRLANCKIVVEGFICPAEIILRLGFLPKKQLSQHNFEISTEYKGEYKDALEAIHLSLDAAATLMDEFLARDEDSPNDYPLVWEESQYKKRPLFYRYSSVNSDLEAEADRLLASDLEADEKSLLH